MKTAVIKLKEIKDVYDFVSIVTAFPGDVDIVSGRYRVNAKSIMGIFALDLTEPLHLEITGDGTDEVLEELKKFAV